MSRNKCKWWWEEEGQDFLTSCRWIQNNQRKMCTHCHRPVQIVKTRDELDGSWKVETPPPAALMQEVIPSHWDSLRDHIADALWHKSKLEKSECLKRAEYCIKILVVP